MGNLDDINKVFREAREGDGNEKPSDYYKKQKILKGIIWIGIFSLIYIGIIVKKSLKIGEYIDKHPNSELVKDYLRKQKELDSLVYPKEWQGQIDNFKKSISEDKRAIHNIEEDISEKRKKIDSLRKLMKEKNTEDEIGIDSLINKKYETYKKLEDSISTGIWKTIKIPYIFYPK